ncbi:MAG: alpha-L-rhamnosidase N-terminal domain-containing protein, partial [Chitinispirillaceae bacterium]|nr:alpha-L-rhamnosidase N-terminal domain-containing protein [Chitinispirillaceae bacterium]
MKFFHGLRIPAAVVSVLTLVASAPAAVSVVNLRCEYLPLALGVDTTIPRFSWQLDDDAATRGQKQTAYQILVASSLALINGNSGDLWNSGTVNSEQSVNVEYAGSPLSSGMDCYWKVRAFDKDGTATGWSAAARFSVGLLTASDWKGSWISMASATDQNCPWFRKTFSLSEIPENAFAYIASAGFHELQVNGQKMNDSAVLSPSVSNMAKRVLYRTYDITSYLKVGNNAIGVWLAPGWSLWPVHNGWPNFNLSKRPIFIGQVEMKSPAGAITRVVTDNTWKCRLSCLTHIGGWQFGNFGGERLDAQNDIPGWSTAELDETGWGNATAYTLSRAISSDLVPPNRKCAVIEAASVTGSGSSCQIKMKEVYTGWIEVKLKGNPGSSARITVNLDGGTGAAMGAQDEYIFDNSGEGTFCNRFNYHEILYVNISGISARPAVTDIKGYRIANDLTRTGSFDCSNALIKKEYDITLNTCGNLTTSGQTVDCPHRERLGYGGDGQG